MQVSSAAREWQVETDSPPRLAAHDPNMSESTSPQAEKKDSGIWGFVWGALGMANNNKTAGETEDYHHPPQPERSSVHPHPAPRPAAEAPVVPRVATTHLQSAPVPSLSQTLPRRTTRVKRPTQRIVHKLNDSNWISAMQLSMWDNISGPKVEILWNVCEDMREDIQLYTARHTLCGVLGQLEPDPPGVTFRPETKFHLYNEQNLIITSTLFAATYYNTYYKFSLSFLTRQDHLQRYLVLHPIVIDRMAQLVSKLRVMLADGSVPKFNQDLTAFIINMDALYRSSLRPSPQIELTPFYNPSQPSPEEIEFLARAVTSHLQTHGSALVTGSDESQVNNFVEALSLFLSAKERRRCSYVVTGQDYVPDMIVQGIVYTSPSPPSPSTTPRSSRARTSSYNAALPTPSGPVLEPPPSASSSLSSSTSSMSPPPSQSPHHGSGHYQNGSGSGHYGPHNAYNNPSQAWVNESGLSTVLADERIILSVQPVTWIDVDRRQVRQTHLFHEYQVLRNHFINAEISRLVGVTPEQNLWSTRDGLFRLSRASASFVHKMISDVFKLPQSLREGYIIYSQRLLQRKAVALIKYVDAERAASGGQLKEDCLKRVRADLGLTGDQDFWLLLGIAEKLWPGIYVTLAGDPAYIEERFIELFESF
eukprot:TRINITY_DN1097_c0_g1_i4.p1 TRINITY_DN1097_c0_g1~~TRINITY_DN1097_c0_g1_i4.p1  ORF type:complete len:649 (-),score=122.12 TRINITY_DN1097_c0_g1_i4:12-1958(-)